MDEPVIHIENLCKDYKLYSCKRERLRETLLPSRKNPPKTHSALRNVSLDVRKGESIGIIGVNGSGKSTLLKILTGVVTPTSGVAEVHGRVSALLELGAGFNLEYTGIENIYLNGTMMNIPKEEMDQLLPEIVAFADIGEFINQPVKNYSSGMFARLAFSVAISVHPDILIVDEALSVGDVFFQNKCYRKFDEFREEGMTILFVSHDLSAISKYCSRSVLLNQGKLVAEGEPREIVDLYKKMLSSREKEEKKKEKGQEAANPEKKAETAWRETMYCNPKRLEYGNRDAEIVDFGVFDENERLTNAIPSGEKCTVRLRIRFHEDVKEPIVAFTVKNKMGIELMGTNTLYGNCETGLCKAGEDYIVSFAQNIHLRSGEYLLSFGCTGYGNDEVIVYHRLYDVCNFLVISSREAVGYFDPESEIVMEKAE